MKEKYYFIDFLKFIFSIIILLFHSKALFDENILNEHIQLFSAGSIAVEFFFIVSGYLIAASCINKVNESYEDFYFHKIKSFVLPLLMSWIICFTVSQLFMENVTVKKIALDSIGSIFELLFLRNLGFQGKYYNTVTWYISALVISTLVVSAPLKKYKEKYVFWAAPIIAFFFLGFLSKEYNSIRNTEKWIGFAYKCQLRAFAEINLGIFMYGIREKYLKTISLTKIGKIVFTWAELLGYTIAIVYMWYAKKPNTLDYAIILILAGSILITFSGKTYTMNLGGKFSTVFSFLGKFSLYIYLNQKVWFKPLKLFNGTYVQTIELYVLMTIVTASCVMIVVNLIRKYRNKIIGIFVDNVLF